MLASHKREWNQDLVQNERLWCLYAMSVISTSSMSTSSSGTFTSQAGAGTPGEQKAAVLRELLIWRGVDLRKIDLPPLPVVPKEKLSMSDAWDCDNQAVRQLVNIPHHKARPIRFKQGYGGPEVRVKSAPSRREPLQEKVGSGVYRRRISTDSERSSKYGRPKPHILPTIQLHNPFKPQGKYFKYTVDFYKKKNKSELEKTD
ncbi:uncharacterized protein LOC106162516 isoform X2 [Lingula anatina]|uniref:Uncharacterized protein LOC106162516 isoform X2 n=1 Tax=Lingula anatina TaxID=7574 RepID=A0A1S3IBN8_LINAN|nr:uncharacterized protein LOC106162516 isoform X2 [Lingula anatina]|eukprot:XP_013395276.1 uncharacterized protein LOC106162516 isoform X2 [Lingula anatina]